MKTSPKTSPNDFAADLDADKNARRESGGQDNEDSNRPDKDSYLARAGTQRIDPYRVAKARERTEVRNRLRSKLVARDISDLDLQSFLQDVEQYARLSVDIWNVDREAQSSNARLS